MAKDYIVVAGAKEHNLRNITVSIPRESLTVITGLSGSGKSSLAFDTIYAEGQRRYVESLSAYARQFLDQMKKPDVDYIEGLAPAIAIEQRTAGSNPRSIVATSTEIHDYLRLLYASIGEPHCPACGKLIERQSAQEIAEQLFALPNRCKLWLLAPLVHGKKGQHDDIFKDMRQQGFLRVRIDGDIHELDALPDLNRRKTHTIDVVVDRLIITTKIRSRLTDSVELALKFGSGALIALDVGNPEKPGETFYSEKHACVGCGISYEELTPRHFSFNSPYGACSVCSGLGTRLILDPGLVIPDHSVSLNKGAIQAWRRGGRRLITYYNGLLRSLAKHYDIDLDTPYEALDADIRQMLMNGSGEDAIEFGYWRGGAHRKYTKPFEGVIPNLERRYEETKSDYTRQRLRRYMTPQPCSNCNGERLKPEVVACTIREKSIVDLTSMSVRDAEGFFAKLKLKKKEAHIVEDVLKEIRQRLGFLANIGLDYLTLDRESGTLSGGEAQRIRLATQIGSGLVGVLYVLDEPSIGLHQRDNQRLIEMLRGLRDVGNTVIVVEHDEETIRSADYVIDLGPAAGRHGGRVMCEGGLDVLLASKDSLTARYLRGDQTIQISDHRRKPKNGHLTIIGATENNLKNVKVQFPLGLFVCVTGVSGSGKSTLVDDILRRALFRKFYASKAVPGAHKALEGIENLDKAIVIDQSPIGRTPRSNPATYTGAFSDIRKLFSALPSSKVRGYGPGRYSFNTKGGRCETCKGDGLLKLEMHFLPDVYVPCENCRGRRYNRETLEVLYDDRSIADVLEMTIEEALEFFLNVPTICRKLKTLADVGLGYLHLGQPATTLSGGEAQRVKLSAELAKRATGRTVYLLDEPTTGLHFADVQKLLHVLGTLCDSGNTVVVIEHNLDVIKCADYIIDLGPEGGDAGGRVIAKGTPEQVARNPASYTGKFLKDVL